MGQRNINLRLKMKLKPHQFQKIILNWFSQHGRKNLPWQKDKTPYRIWVSEIMLQQTQVNTVIPYFERFMQQFPTLESLAKAEEDTVFHFWAGLGYYHRAKHLHYAAKKIFFELQGKFPNELTELESLPGIGRSTAGAILSIAFGKNMPILDGNVKRVLTRLHGITEWPGEKTTGELLWTIAEKYTPNKNCADYTQAMMDLGATLCTRGKPQCEQCPLQKYCVAHEKGLEKQLPKAKPRKTLPVRMATLLIIRHQQSVLLEKRPTKGVWSGLWSLPEITGTPSMHDIKLACRNQFHLTIKKLQFSEPFRHTFSHYHLDITPALLVVEKKPPKIMEDTQQIWYNLRESPLVGIPQPVKSILNQLE